MAMLGPTSRLRPDVAAARIAPIWPGRRWPSRYAIAFLQRVSPQSITASLMHDFNTDAAGVAMLA